MNGWKIADVAGLALVSAIFGAFTYFMGRSLFEDGLAISTGYSLAVLLFASVLLHVLLLLAALTLGSLCAMVYRATH